MSRYRFIEANKAEFHVSVMCRVLGVSRSRYYAWRAEPVCGHAKRDQALSVAIQAAFKASRKRYGAPRIYRVLKAQEYRVSRKRVARLMAEMGLVARRRRKYVVTTKADKDAKFPENVLDRKFSPQQPNEVWAGDISYIPTGQGWMYLAVLLDLFSRKVVGWALSNRIDAQLVVAAAQMAFRLRQPPATLIHHTDRGRQYTSIPYVELIDEVGVTRSMSRKGNCWDNAVSESFFSSLKFELGLIHGRFPNRHEARIGITEYMLFYNHERLHSTLDYVSPVEYERSVRDVALAA